MFTRILVPLDGSRRSERALPYAAGLAKASGGELVLIHDETVGLRGDDGDAAEKDQSKSYGDAAEENELGDLGRLNHADRARQEPQHAGLAEPELAGDGFVRKASRDEFQHLPFASGERLARGGEA